MHIERIRQIDSGEPDDSGLYDYYYEYDIYRFTDGPNCLFARSYTHEPDEAHFLSIAVHGSRRALSDVDLAHPLCLFAQTHLRSEGKVHLRWLSGRGDGYESVPASPQHGA